MSSLARALERDAARATRCHDLWFTERERAVHAAFVVPKRRHDWVAGRVTAKEVVRRRYGLCGIDALRRIEIRTLGEGELKGKPRYEVDGVEGSYDLSISHSGDVAVAALATAKRERLGIDIEQVTERAASFEEIALSHRERDSLAGLRGECRAREVTARWVIKEALSKALGLGLRLRFDQITVDISPGHSVRIEATPATPASPLLSNVAITSSLTILGTMCVGTVLLREVA